LHWAVWDDIMKKMKKVYLATLILPLMLTACLKTRAQLRDDRPEEVEETKTMPAHPVAEVQSEGRYAVEEIKSELTRLVGRVEDLERSNKEQQAKGTSGDLKKLEDKVTALSEKLAQVSDSMTKLSESPALMDPDEVYGRGKSQYESEDYGNAAETLGAYLKLPKGKHAEEATFLRAESYFKLKQYKKAIVDYSKFPEKYNRSVRMPQALLKIGQAFEALGMKDDAKGFFQELIEKYPKSAEAKKVRKRVK
jgi:tol-pal system protein YbgF